MKSKHVVGRKASEKYSGTGRDGTGESWGRRSRERKWNLSARGEKRKRQRKKLGKGKGLEKEEEIGTNQLTQPDDEIHQHGQKRGVENRRRNPTNCAE